MKEFILNGTPTGILNGSGTMVRVVDGLSIEFDLDVDAGPARETLVVKHVRVSDDMREAAKAFLDQWFAKYGVKVYLAIHPAEQEGASRHCFVFSRPDDHSLHFDMVRAGVAQPAWPQVDLPTTMRAVVE